MKEELKRGAGRPMQARRDSGVPDTTRETYKRVATSARTSWAAAERRHWGRSARQ